jgi:adenosylcobinamide-phosphate synthase
MTTAAILLLALALDALIGWPGALYRRTGHPVTWLGKLITHMDKSLNRTEWHPPTRRLMGILTAAFIILICIVSGQIIQNAVGQGLLGFLISVLLMWPLLAARSLYTHVKDVAQPLELMDLRSAREAVSMIVGRDPKQLDTAGVGRAAIESLAENASDGVVAPIFWGLVFGLPGILAYKAINTMDSMIGYKTPRHSDFGWAAARIDDVANWIPARFTGLIIALMSGTPNTALLTMKRDASKHRSPNAGWPESAMAAALGVRLSGPRSYHDKQTNDPWLYAEGRDVDGADVTRALAVFKRSMFCMAGLLAILALI